MKSKKEKKKMKLVCLPYAGGSAMMYGRWRGKLGKDIEILQLELPGRGLRFKDKNAQNMEELTEDLAERLEIMVGDSDYVLLGFCYGAIVAYSLYQHIYKNIKNKNRGLKLPKGLILISSLTPGNHTKAERLFEMSNFKIVKLLLGVFSFNPWKASEEEMDILKTMLEIINPEVAEELRRTPLYKLVIQFLFPKLGRNNYCQDVLRIMKEDGKIMYQYNAEKETVPFMQPVLAIHGKTDNVVSLENMEKWEAFCEDAFYLKEVAGGHLMLFDEDDSLLELIESTVYDFYSERIERRA